MGEEPTLQDELSEYQRWLRTLETTAAGIVGRHSEVTERLTQAQLSLTHGQSEVEILEQTTTLLQGLESVWNKQFQKSVAKVITRGLMLVFDTPMELRIDTKVRADVTTVDFKIIQGEGKDAFETPILGAKGGTVVALVNVLVRTLLILSARPALRRLLILDEPFGLADDSYIPAFGSLLREICDRLKFQVIVVSHEAALVDVADYAYEAYKVSRRKGTGFRLIHDRNEVQA